MWAHLDRFVQQFNGRRIVAFDITVDSTQIVVWAGMAGIDGDRLFARVMSYETRDETSLDAVLEAHRRYVDIQMALIGSERIAWYPTPSLQAKSPYDEEKDVQFFVYERPADIQVSVFPGTFACLFPQDAHMPQLKSDAKGGEVKKVVVKIDLDLLTL